jgi:hypothetical protein
VVKVINDLIIKRFTQPQSSREITPKEIRFGCEFPFYY